MEKVPYARAIRSVMYAMVCYLPDIAYSVSQLSKYMSKPVLWVAMKWLLRDLSGTRGLGLTFGMLNKRAVE